MGVDGLAYEDLVARMSVPLFGGTGRRSLTIENTDQGYPFFRHAYSWWKAMGPHLIRSERDFADDLDSRLEALRRSASRGRQYLALLDHPILLRRVWLNEVETVGKAARLFKKAIHLAHGNVMRRRLASQSKELLLTHAQTFETLRASLKRIHECQGVAKTAFDKISERQREIHRRAKMLSSDKMPSFEKVFWPETETPYSR
jgi:hypothetical protein